MGESTLKQLKKNLKLCPEIVDYYSMNLLRERQTLHTFSERVAAYAIRVYGNFAVAIVGCEMFENNQDHSYDVSAISL